MSQLPNQPLGYIIPTVTEEDLKELKNSQKQKIIFTKPFATYKVGDVLEIKVLPNRYQSEPPSFLVVQEKLGSFKYGFGGRGSTPFYKLYEEQSNVNRAIPIGSEPLNIYPKVNLSPEEKFYQSLGLKSRGGWSPTAKAKGRFLVAVVLVAGYFAYKKFKK
jgi:hypothetical protein